MKAPLRALASVAAALLIAAGPACGACGATEILDQVPAPSLETVETSIRSQLEEARESAIAVFRASPAAAPGVRANAVGLLGRLYALYSFFDAAEAALRAAQDLAPEDPRWHYLLGVVLQQNRRYAEADSAFASVLEQVPGDLSARVRRAQIALEAQRTEDAAAQFTSLVADHPTLAVAYHGLAQTAETRGDYAQAASLYEKVLELQPAATAVRYPLGLAYRQLGDIEEARAQLAARGDTQVSFPDPLVDALRAENAGSAALVVAGNHAMSRGDYRTAVEAYGAAARRSPEDARSRLMLASALSLAGETESAIAAYREALADSSGPEPVSEYNLGNLLLTKGDLDGAIAAFRQAIADAPDFTNALINLAGALEQTGDLGAAASLAARAAALAPEDESVILLEARLLAQKGDVVMARTHIQSILDRRPGSAPAWVALATLAARSGDGETARMAFARAVDAAGHGDVAADAYRGLAALEPDHAIEHLESAIAAAPDRGDLAQQLAAAYGRAGRLAEAATQYRRAALSAPDDIGAQFGLATALILAGKHADARQALESGTARLPGALPLHHVLARLLATSGRDNIRDGARALALAQRVFRAQPSIDHAETVGMALAELGRFDEAAALQRQIIDRAASDGQSDRLKGLRARLLQYQRGEPGRDRRGLEDQ